MHKATKSTFTYPHTPVWGHSEAEGPSNRIGEPLSISFHGGTPQIQRKLERRATSHQLRGSVGSPVLLVAAMADYIDLLTLTNQSGIVSVGFEGTGEKDRIQVWIQSNLTGIADSMPDTAFILTDITEAEALASALMEAIGKLRQAEEDRTFD